MKIYRFMVVIFILGLVIWSLMACVFVKGCKMIQDKGLKGIVETVWEGTNKVEITP